MLEHLLLLLLSCPNSNAMTFARIPIIIITLFQILYIVIACPEHLCGISELVYFRYISILLLVTDSF